VLAYVFWHAPASEDPDLATYEAALAAFHQRLDPAEIKGFRGSHAFLVDGAEWLSASAVYEDWYLVDDFTALGELNTAAVSGHRQPPHDHVAGMAAKGMAGLYALRQGEAQLFERPCAWFGKPAGVSYGEFFGELGERSALWQRELVLGPTPEFCSLDDDNPPKDALTVARIRRIAGSAS
jgi:hypothetical protein